MGRRGGPPHPLEEWLKPLKVKRSDFLETLNKKIVEQTGDEKNQIKMVTLRFIICWKNLPSPEVFQAARALTGLQYDDFYPSWMLRTPSEGRAA